MAIGIVGVKTGMTRVFNSDGASVPVTVVKAEPNRVTQVKSVEQDRYLAVQVTRGSAREKDVRKPLNGHFEKGGVQAGIGLWEFRPGVCTLEHEIEELATGAELSVGQFSKGQSVDVCGISKGKGYAGPIKRWNFSSQDYTHGNSLSHRAGGAIGQCQTPGKVFKGKKMAGHLGNARVTVQNLEVVDVDLDQNLLLIKGAIPGSNGGTVVVRPALKAGIQSLQEEVATEDGANE